MYIVASIDSSTVALVDFGSHHGVGHNSYARLLQTALLTT